MKRCVASTLLGSWQHVMDLQRGSYTRKLLDRGIQASGMHVIRTTEPRHVKRWRHPETGNAWRVATLPEDRSSHGHMHQKFGEVRPCGFGVQSTGQEIGWEEVP